jgi:hypothetical protein
VTVFALGEKNRFANDAAWALELEKSAIPTATAFHRAGEFLRFPLKSDAGQSAIFIVRTFQER